MAIEIGDYQFEDPALLGEEFTCPGAGVFVVLSSTESEREDTVKDGQGYIYRVIYVNESAGGKIDLSHPAWNRVHDLYPKPYVAFLSMKESNELGRRSIAASLITIYQPFCND